MFPLKVLMLAPGVIVHELGHLLLCRLSGVAVRRFVLFQIASPAGFVIHAKPRLLRQHLAISGGPLVVSSALSVALFVLSARLFLLRPIAWWPVVTLVASWQAWSIALEAWPSKADAGALRGAAAYQLRQLNPGAILALPLAWSLLLVGASRRIGGHWLYAALLAAVALRLVGTQN